MRSAQRSLVASFGLVVGCGGDPLAPPTRPVPTVIPEPVLPVLPAEPPAPARAPTPPGSPCEKTLGTPAGVAVEYTYFYNEAPGSCVLPLSLFAVGCPTFVRERNPNGPERDADVTLSYGTDGRLAGWTTISPHTQEVLERVAVTLDERGRPVREVRDVPAGAGENTYEWNDRTVTWRRGSFRTVFELDDQGRPIRHDDAYAGSTFDRAQWIYDGDRLERIEVDGTNTSTHRFAYTCPDAIVR